MNGEREAWPSTAGPRRWGYIPPEWVPRLRTGGRVGGQMFCPSTAEGVRNQIAAAVLDKGEPDA